MVSTNPAQGLFPPELTVAVHSRRGPGDLAQLQPEERALIASASGRRPGEFAAGRLCAHGALGALGLVPAPVLRVGRAPVWPEGVVGSISHTSDRHRTEYAIAAARCCAADEYLTTIGVDAEVAGRVGEDLHERLFTDVERVGLAAGDPATRADRATVLFSAKEAFYKAQHPQTNAWVGFEDVSIFVSGSELTLERATELAALDTFAWPVHGRWVRDGDVVITAVWTSRRAVAP